MENPRTAFFALVKVVSCISNRDGIDAVGRFDEGDMSECKA